MKIGFWGASRRVFDLSLGEMLWSRRTIFMPYLVDSIDARWGHKMGHFQFVDAMYRDGFQCPLSNLIMLAAIQYSPSGRFGSIAAAVLPAATPRSRAARRSGWGKPLVPSQYSPREAFQADSKSLGSAASRAVQMSTAFFASGNDSRSR